MGEPSRSAKTAGRAGRESEREGCAEEGEVKGRQSEDEQEEEDFLIDALSYVHPNANYIVLHHHPFSMPASRSACFHGLRHDE